MPYREKNMSKLKKIMRAGVVITVLLAAPITVINQSKLALSQTSQSSLIAGNISIDVNQTIDQIVDKIRFKTKFNILVVNKTGDTLTRAGSYNDSANWPIGDIEGDNAQLHEFEGSAVNNSFSFAGNYKTKDGKYFQFVATWPTIGSRKIGLADINEDGNEPAKTAWDRTNDSNDKSVSNPPYRARAFMTTKGDSVVWVYEVTK
jgi:hypothetical protein